MDWESRDCKGIEAAILHFNVESGLPFLHYYSRENDFKRCEVLLKNGLDPNIRIQYGVNEDVTPLMIACQFDCIDVAKTLLAYGADCNLTNSQGSTALHYCMFNNSPELVKLLIHSGAKVNVFTAERALWTAEFDCFLFETPLHLASSNGYLTCVEILVEAGADINSKRWDERTPLMFASAFGQNEVVEYLCNKGADVSCRANQKQYGIQTDYSALHFSARNGHRGVYEILLRFGANAMAIECNTGMTAKEMLENYEASGDFLTR
ncbi:ankyrin repeat domain-containing protein [Vibrio breoganii]|uniref:ankyrin repeat domain-containing protein n=1 Tax=Vibrio breoganii TaxID=553239 RepID=UPI000C826B96|nr:ankyrin repeat domain-containing protein [Vibrio breoganii]PML61919.1 hypothetical protein BCT73_05920 [Vibrio breoganii]PMO81134.1 hypothetical protein BCT00_12375 [Vibrio breoganii]